MKTTKVLGIVLGTLLVAGLFVGAAAADDVDLGNVYTWAVYTDGQDLSYYELINLTETTEYFPISAHTEFTNAAGDSVTFLYEGTITEGIYVPKDYKQYYINGNDVKAEGEYYCAFGGNKYIINVKFPTAAISGAVYKGEKSDENLTSSLIGSVVMNDKVIFVNPLTDAAIAYTNPDGSATTVNPASVHLNVDNNRSIKDADLGIWTLQAYYAKSLNHKIGGKTISKFAPDFILGKPYYFTVVSSNDDKKLEVLSENIVQGGYATVKVTAPTGTWIIKVIDGIIPGGQPLMSNIDDATDAKINIGSDGVGYFSVTTQKTSNIKIELYDPKSTDNVPIKTLTIKVNAGAVSAETDDASVYIGNEFDVAGTNDLGGTLYLFIKGTNYKFQPVTKSFNEYDFLTASGKVWSATVNTYYMDNAGKKPDVGTYTVYIASLTDEGLEYINVLKSEDMDNSDYVKAYATVAVALKQPFISITKAPEVLVQGEKYVVEGTAEGEPKNVQYYIFGTNKFLFGTEPVTDGVFSIELTKDQTSQENMAAGQYFLVIQHPMYDKAFNIGANLITKDVILNKTGNWYDDEIMNTVLFNVNGRQSANAAQALCDNLENQDIDDMYAKQSFVVAGPTSYIDAIPSQITKGQVLTISGTTTGHNGDVVSVELLSTAFAAIPKEAVGSASFVALTTRIGDDGTWSISFDTSSLNADTYTCSVAVGQLDATTSKITIVDNGGSQPTAQPSTQPTAQPTAAPTAQPTATPATPGFGALAALAGLGAVAVLLLRRQ